MDTILSGYVAEVSELLQNSRSLQGSNCLGQTAAHVAVLRPKILSMLLDLSPVFDARDIDGNSPLVYAAAYGCLESVVLLLRAGANPLND
jgi:ankyrin repeat protein